MKVSRDAWLLLGIIVTVVVLLALAGPEPERESKLPTTYNAGANGAKAFYTLAGRLGYTVDRLLDPYTDMPPGVTTLVVIAPEKATPIVTAETDALESWVRAGGTAIFISDSLAGVPARFGSTRKLGKGSIYALSSAKVVTNKGLRDYRSAVKMLDIISAHAGPRDLVLFDEYHHGLGHSASSGILAHIQRQVKAGVLVIAIALLVLCYGRGRRFGAVRDLPSWESRRPGFEYVESVARLYERAGAAGLAADILVTSLRHELCRRLGLPPDAPRESIVRQLESDRRPEMAGRVDRLLSSVQAGQKLGRQELLSVAREVHSVENELGIGAL